MFTQLINIYFSIFVDGAIADMMRMTTYKDVMEEVKSPIPFSQANHQLNILTKFSVVNLL